jgi:hypothetical protein
MNSHTTLPAAAQSLEGCTKQWPIEVRALLARLQRSALVKSNRRRGGRRPFLFEAVAQFDDARRGSQRVTVHTRDRTDTHIAFLTDAHLEIGQAVDLDFTVTPATETLGRVACRVRRCRQFQEGWFECVVHIGVDVRRPLSWRERVLRWLGETTGFGPDEYRGNARRRRAG